MVPINLQLNSVQDKLLRLPLEQMPLRVLLIARMESQLIREPLVPVHRRLQQRVVRQELSLIKALMVANHQV
jgi:hypothetical protein